MSIINMPTNHTKVEKDGGDTVYDPNIQGRILRCRIHQQKRIKQKRIVIEVVEENFNHLLPCSFALYLWFFSLPRSHWFFLLN